MEERRSTLKFDLVITAVIFIIACIGIGVAACNRVDKGLGTITTQNYAEYFQVECTFTNGMGGGNRMTYNYKIYVKAKPYHKLSDLKITIEIESEYSDFGTQSLEIEYVDPLKPFEKSGSAEYVFPNEPDGRFPAVTVTVVSASGKYAYINERGEA